MSIEKKLEALKKLDIGENGINAAMELGVGKSTNGDWKIKRSKIESLKELLLKERKSMKESDFI